jgi:hypothetical protein
VRGKSLGSAHQVMVSLGLNHRLGVPGDSETVSSCLGVFLVVCAGVGAQFDVSVEEGGALAGEL